MEGMKFDKGKARWDLVPTEIFNSMAVAMKPFIETYMLKDGEIIFDVPYLYNMVRANITRWRLMGKNCYLVNTHPVMNAMIAILMLAKQRHYTAEELNVNFSQRWDLIDSEWTKNIAEIFAFGAKKYADDNWKLVEPSRYYSALNRHLDWYWAGEAYDAESGYLHLYHAAWNCIALLWFDRKTDVEITSKIPESIIKASRKLGQISLRAAPPKKKKH